jgi:peptidoglycan hydrolase-like protein with peptidoglycan-binding domain
MIDISKGQRRGALLLLLCMAVAMTLAAAGTAQAARPGAAAAPSLAPGAGFDGRDRTAVVQIQLRLRRLGYGPGPIDGLYGPLTAGAVRRLQAANKVVVDGIAGRVTQRVLTAQSTARPSTVRRAQRRLRGLGHHPGTVDGLLGPRTVTALHEFRAQRPATQTVRVLARLDETASREAAPRSNAPAAPQDSATDAPTTTSKAAPRQSAPTDVPTTDEAREPAPTAAPPAAQDPAPRAAAPDPTPAAPDTTAPTAGAEATPATQQPETSRPARSESGSSPAAGDTPAPAGSGGGATSETPVASTVPRPPSSATPLPRTKEAPLDAVIPVSAPADEAKPPLAGTFSTSAALLILAVAVLAFLFGRDTGRPGRREPGPEPERGEPPAMARVPVHEARGRRPGAGPRGPKRRGAGRHES